MSNPSYASTIVQLAYSFAQELNRFYQKNKAVIDTQRMVPSNLLTPAEITRRDVKLFGGEVTLRFDCVWEDWGDKDEENHPKVKGLLFTVDAQIEFNEDLSVTFLCNTGDTYDTISTRFQRHLSAKLANMDRTIAKMKMMLSSLEDLN